MDINNVINGENFKQIANIIIDSDTLSEKRKYKDGDIIFCKTDFLNILFNETFSSTHNYTLITHLSDYSINEYLFSHKSKSIKKWFAQNVDFKHPDLIPIPIGIENHKGASKGTCINQSLWEKYNLKDSYQKTSKAYINFSLTTHSSRKEWFHHLKTKNFHFSTNIPYIDYLEDLKKNDFCISPRGNGIDCHRTWESLYFECIPIVPKHFIYDTFNLPIIQIESPEEITNDFIEHLQKRKNSGDFKINKQNLTLEHWIDKIKKEAIL